MGHAKIKYFKVNDFRNIKDAKIDFSNSPIISLVGDNESGKTSIIKAFSVLALHNYTREQKDFIRDGTKKFKLELGLEDGTIITREKGIGVNNYKIKSPEGRIWEIDKIETTLPTKVQEIIDLFKEPETGESLQIRTYEDKLLFIVTPGSTNYKVFYNALKVEHLTKAIRTGLDEINKLKKELENGEKSKQTLLQQVRNIRTIDINPALNIRERIKYQIKNIEKIRNLIALKNKINEIEQKLTLKSQTYKQIKNLQEIDINTIKKIQQCMQFKQKIKEITKRIKKIDTKYLKEIDEKTLLRVQIFKKMAQNYNKILETYHTLKTINKEIKKIEGEKKELIKKIGVPIIECPKCNEIIPIKEGDS